MRRDFLRNYLAALIDEGRVLLSGAPSVERITSAIGQAIKADLRFVGEDILRAVVLKEAPQVVQGRRESLRGYALCLAAEGGFDPSRGVEPMLGALLRSVGADAAAVATSIGGDLLQRADRLAGNAFASLLEETAAVARRGVGAVAEDFEKRQEVGLDVLRGRR